MGIVDQLGAFARRLHAGEDPARVKEEARRFLAGLDPLDLTLAEQRLLDAGVSPEDLRALCPLHREMLSADLVRMRQRLPAGHVLATLIAEHERLLDFLDELEQLNGAIQRLAELPDHRDVFERLDEVAEHLVGAEKHHRREEDVLFPALEAHGLSGPPLMLRMEHHDLRALKRGLKDLAEHVDGMRLASFQPQLAALVQPLLHLLHDHIVKENNILYPAALRLLSDEPLWRELKDACDRIGYCCFTPMDEV